MNDRKKMKRGAVRKSESVFLGVWVPSRMVRALDDAVDSMDSDRSKFVRAALEEKVNRLGVRFPIKEVA